MINEFDDIYQQVARQLGHWAQASSRLSKLEELASPAAWRGLEHYLNVKLKSSLQQGLSGLQGNALVLQRQLHDAKSVTQLKQLQQQLDIFKKKYLQTETMLDFYADAINSRTNDDMAALMRACDRIAHSSMKMILAPMGKLTPPVLTYIDKGLGASILKANLRLWDGKTKSPAAAIKVVRHNLYRPTAIIHECGHQIAHILNWNKELKEILFEQLNHSSVEVAELWAGWASEIAADTFAFAHTGYASVAGLCDVVSGNSKFVFRYRPGDPHPISYLRLLLGTAMCRISYGEGPWDQMERVWKQKYIIKDAPSEVQVFIRQSLPLLNKIAHSCLQIPMKAFGNKPITFWIKPNRVDPHHLIQLKKQAGNSLYTSHHWVTKEAIRLLALGGYQIATAPSQVPQLLEQQRKWMLTLGRTLQVA